jgi:hypothetical protein
MSCVSGIPRSGVFARTPHFGAHCTPFLAVAMHLRLVTGSNLRSGYRVFVVVNGCLRRADEYASTGLKLSRLCLVFFRPVASVDVNQVFRALIYMHGIGGWTDDVQQLRSLDFGYMTHDSRQLEC